MIPLPHTLQGMEKKSDMFDSKVLAKKYQDGREDFFFPLTKLSHLDLPDDIFFILWRLLNNYF